MGASARQDHAEPHLLRETVFPGWAEFGKNVLVFFMFLVIILNVCLDFQTISWYQTKTMYQNPQPQDPQMWNVEQDSMVALITANRGLRERAHRKSLRTDFALIQSKLLCSFLGRVISIPKCTIEISLINMYPRYLIPQVKLFLNYSALSIAY